jgi:hypothetical protein
MLVYVHVLPLLSPCRVLEEHVSALPQDLGRVEARKER